MSVVYLGIGTNLGDKEDNLRFALENIEEQIGKIISCSVPYASEAWGFESKNSFLNIVVSIETQLAPFDLLDVTQKIEKLMGREKKSVDGVYSDRIIDIDILLYDNIKMNTDRLILPHPGLKDRLFFQIPLKEINPDF
ncbi:MULTISPECIES: 2-amino-4-hydroxy-6-hydroxymethyldihydropteridine diphosphokinase [Bacteroidales]|jgi:2-amino-4-hydroxy-6-hydroxymethyldihydropteridine diphosphokinase|uniref:2-amino-4-hydroxy-6- hydroxymethyldihydropteridine diphosphokinase n=1 Tax=Bacteroidales TaxID=171549 RepID=UPI0006D7CC4D|nr:2-amino-4-hydroxy-6-hydroxymethyldihydropteridine diphosphokinase [Gabonia massiliensis]